MEKQLAHLPDHFQGKKLRILELGTGRGGMSRRNALSLKEQGKLDVYVCANISTVENRINQQNAKAVGLDEPEYVVRQISFDDIYGEGTVKKGDQFDIICSCEALYHSKKRGEVISTVKELLLPGGIFYLSDLMENADSPQENRDLVKQRFADSIYGSVKEYCSLLDAVQMEKVEVIEQTYHLQRHYGLIRHTAVTSKKAELLGPGGMSQEFYDKAIAGLDVWIKQSALNHVNWAVFIYRKPSN